MSDRAVLIEWVVPIQLIHYLDSWESSNHLKNSFTENAPFETGIILLSYRVLISYHLIIIDNWQYRQPD